uniref:Golgi SNAP receptor complex member 1 n=1 Tax=Skeletonema marinoi TaxID=267567 RepID=A0A6U3U4U0_9STRA|mmetsp:Transcript_15880/g.26826  ORF Transcript_15880/g.26826 Transcript_15880/m.26826 type:complete len:283 (+) Transcript_15880:296-1144(+)
MNAAPPSGGATTNNSSSTYGMTPEQASKNFDVLRREATKLERHLEDRVARYQQLAQRLTVDNNNSTSDNDPLGQQSSLMIDSGGSSSSYTTNPSQTNKSNLDEEEATLSKDIHRTMSTMTELINTKMAPAAERTGRSQHLLLVKRYREILFDCGADFNKTSAAVARRREAKELFRGATAGNGGGGGGANPEMEQLLRERNAIDNSMKSANSVLNQAASVRTELRSQGASLRGVGGTMAAIAGNIPGLNGLIDKIRKKRQQDDRVVSGVVAACILFTLWYLFG